MPTRLRAGSRLRHTELLPPFYGPRRQLAAYQPILELREEVGVGDFQPRPKMHFGQVTKGLLLPVSELKFAEFEAPRLIRRVHKFSQSRKEHATRNVIGDLVQNPLRLSFSVPSLH